MNINKEIVGWISVEKRLPEIYKLVFVYDERQRKYSAGVGIHIGQLGRDIGEYFWYIDLSSDTFDFEDVKFWSPLMDKPPLVSEE